MVRADSQPHSKYIFVTGGVVSSLGKGLTAASLAALLQARGYSVRLRKLDPYLNVDAGTMRPYEHGEVFVTDDGGESDLDLGHYERFTNVAASRRDSITAGQVYNSVINGERRGDSLGATIQVIPHITNAIREAILADDGEQDFTICEIGGTVGDIEGLPFLEAIRQFRSLFGTECSLFLHCTLVPYIRAAKEFKTKPSQHSVKELLSLGIQPDILICRIDQAEAVQKDESFASFDREHLVKIARFCNVRTERVIPAFNNSSIYRVPQQLMVEALDAQVLSYFDMEAPTPNLSVWEKIDRQLEGQEGSVRIALIGKYVSHQDAYKSVYEALTHAGCSNDVKVQIKSISSESFESEDSSVLLDSIDGVLIPGGFGRRGMDGKIKAIQYAREHGLPFFGICLGMQMAVIEAARNLAGIADADTSEEYEDLHKTPCSVPIVGLIEEWTSGNRIERRNASSHKGGTMRVGSYDCIVKPKSLLNDCYGQSQIRERHRHRYEVNVTYRDALEAAGLVFSGMSPDGRLPEAVEYPDHPWFVGVQFHPELLSRPFQVHPLFDSFVRAAIVQSRLV